MEKNLRQNDKSTDYRVLLKRALHRITELEQALEKAERGRHNESIAIVGIGCRLPGDMNNPSSFWDFLREGNDAITEVPSDRWDVNAFYDPDPDIPNKTYSRHGAFLKNIDMFDPQFFGIAPREAISMDPQQRLLLEVTWESLENAGQNPLELTGSKTGVFIGIWSNDYSTLQITSHLTNLDMYFGAGNCHSIASGRISYVLGLRGPCISVDTACSSSLLAAHLACQSLRRGECDMALAGGVNLILSPHSTIIATKANMLSRDGHCKTFDASADGYVRGEGCGMMVMKRLSDAIAHKDHIYAVIRGSATNHDGRSNGLSAPSARAQEEVIRSAFADANISPGQVHYIEAHGTGTNLGDPIEMQALGEVFDRSHSSSDPLFIGTVKTNIGHLEAAAGVTGLIKTALVLQQKEIPPHLHLKEPNPLISWNHHPFKIPVVRTPWPERNGRRIAGVSSFGFSGTNVHMILEEAPVFEVKEAEVERPLHVLALSALNEAALRELAGRYVHHLSKHAEDSLADVCFTANLGRAHFDHRLAMVAESSTQVQEQLGIFVRGETPSGVFCGQKGSMDRPRIAFLFTGQGSQYVGMGRELYETQPTFRKALELCDELLRPYLEQPLLTVLYPAPGHESPLDETVYTQPALFALEYALAELWRSWGVEPSVVMGHSVGEYVAACVAGVFSLEDGLKLITERARLMYALPQDGKMAAIFAGEPRVAAAIGSYADTVSIAAINGPENIVISGECGAVHAVLKELERQGITAHRLTVSHAFHSPLMEPILETFERVAAKVSFFTPRIELVSNVTGKPFAPEEIPDARYWCRHIRATVRFAKAIETLHKQGEELFLELGPHPVLLGMGRQCVPEQTGIWLPSLRKGREDWPQMLESLSTLYVNGLQIDWQGFDRDYVRRRVVLPTYTFQRKRYWVDHAKPPKSEKTLTQTVLEPDIGSWLYQVAWLPRDLLTDTNAAPPVGLKRYLIFADCTGLANRLSDQLQKNGAECTLVFRGDSFRMNSDGSYAIDPTAKDSMTHALESYFDSKGDEPFGVVHMWSLDSGDDSHVSRSWLDEVHHSLCGSVLHLVQAMDELDRLKKARLWIVTRGAQIGPWSSLRQICQASLWGLGRVIMSEFPDLAGRLIDLDARGSVDEDSHLLREIMTTDGENQIAFNQGIRRAARLTPYPSAPLPEEGFTINKSSSYLITGGLGGLGLQIAMLLAERGARQLVLVGRSAPSPSAENTIAQIEKMGTSVYVRRTDIAREDDVKALFREIDEHMPPLRGVAHLAGILDDGVLSRQSWERFAKVMAPKVSGAWNLHVLTQKMDLDFFVLFSSASSILGAAGQGSYASANAFLDGLAQFRHSTGLPAMSINWGAWDEVGMASLLGRRDQRRMVSNGIEFITRETGLNILAKLLQRSCAGIEKGTAQVAVLPIDWKELFRSNPKVARMPLFADVAKEQASEIDRQTKPGLTKAALLEADPEEHQGLLESYLAEQVARELMIPLPELDIRQPLPMLGFDSLMAVAVRNQIEREFGITLPMVRLLEGRSVVALAHLIETSLWSAKDRQTVVSSQGEGREIIDI